MKKLIGLMLILTLVGSLFIGCGKTEDPASTPDTPDVEAPADKDEEPADKEDDTTGDETGDETGAELTDGIYFASEDAFSDSGWKYVLTLEVKDGKIATVDWNGAHKDAGKDKKTVSADGEYGMVEKGKAIAEWHEQAAAVEAFLVENQDVNKITITDEEGHTDAISGATIKVGTFVDLVNKALENGPVGTGKYADGNYYVEADEAASSGWKSTASFTVINGNIVAANWNGVKEGMEKDKKTASIDGEYGMVENGNASAPWHEQAAAVENFLIETQDVDAIVLNDEGKTDAVTGATISVGDFVELAKEALVLR